MENSDKRTNLFQLLDATIPNLNDIEKELKSIEPEIISQILDENPESVYIFDYYFRLFSPEIGSRIINHEKFSIQHTIELFNCQLIRYYRVNLFTVDWEIKNESILKSYWTKVKRFKLVEIFKFLHKSGKVNQPYSILILKRLNHTNILELIKGKDIKSKALLDLFKNLGENIKDMIAEDFDLVPHIFALASELGDTQYLEFLDEYTMLTVQLRIAQSLLEEAEQYVDESGKIAFPKLIEVVKNMPKDCLDLTLQMFEQKGYIDKNLKNELAEVLRDK
jgi:hypothetical protein